MSTAAKITVRQWFALPKPERAHRIAAFRAADAALQSYDGPDGSGRFSDDDETYNVLNDRVNELWPTLPWWWRP
jgi:hypothetical protein